MRCALINTHTGLVENLIMADPETDRVDEGYILIGDIPDRLCIGDSWTGTEFNMKTPEYVTGLVGNSQPVQIDGLDTL